MNKLKTCPFCGKDVKEWNNLNATTVNVIECTHCKVRFVFPCSIMLSVTEDNYVQTFNKRCKIGEWIERGKNLSPYCSLCGAVGNGSNYCGHCGAEMHKKNSLKNVYFIKER